MDLVRYALGELDESEGCPCLCILPQCLLLHISEVIASWWVLPFQILE
jgi:hypothetical protein